LLPAFLYHCLTSAAGVAQISKYDTGSAQPNLSAANVAQYEIPLPPLEAQRSIVSEIEAERRLVEANRELIVRMETKLAATLERIWGDNSAAVQKCSDSDIDSIPETQCQPISSSPSGVNSKRTAKKPRSRVTHNAKK